MQKYRYKIYASRLDRVPEDYMPVFEFALKHGVKRQYITTAAGNGRLAVPGGKVEAVIRTDKFMWVHKEARLRNSVFMKNSAAPEFLDFPVQAKENK